MIFLRIEIAFFVKDFFDQLLPTPPQFIWNPNNNMCSIFCPLHIPFTTLHLQFPLNHFPFSVPPLSKVLPCLYIQRKNQPIRSPDVTNPNHKTKVERAKSCTEMPEKLPY